MYIQNPTIRKIVLAMIVVGFVLFGIAALLEEQPAESIFFKTGDYLLVAAAALIFLEALVQLPKNIKDLPEFVRNIAWLIGSLYKRITNKDKPMHRLVEDIQAKNQIDEVLSNTSLTESQKDEAILKVLKKRDANGFITQKSPTKPLSKASGESEAGTSASTNKVYMSLKKLLLVVLIGVVLLVIGIPVIVSIQDQGYGDIFSAGVLYFLVAAVVVDQILRFYSKHQVKPVS